MRKVLKFLIPALIISILVGVLFYEPALSKDQKTILELYDYPKQFVITYLPRGDADNPQLVRSETWYYPEIEKSIAFLGGSFAYEDIYKNDENLNTTLLKPQDFDFFLTYKDMEDIFGVENIIPVNLLPVLYEEGTLATYITEEAMFIIENNQLTYFQTLGLSQELDTETEVSDLPEKENIEDVEEKQKWDTYENKDLGMKIKYPAEWYLESDNTVLSTYDTDYMSEGLELPEKRLKCDFFNYSDSNIEIRDENKIVDKKASVYEGKVELSENSLGPGYGDGYLFIFKQENKDTVGLLCYTYDKYYYTQLIEMLKTFEFTD